MNSGLDKYLVEKYPKIFADRHASVQVSCMAFGFEHNDGWFWLLDQLCESIQNYIDYNSKKTIIKNKYLRNLSKRLIRLSYKRQYSKYKLFRKILKFQNNLLYRMSNYIESKSKKIEIETIPQVVATQVKEKFGSLNFYYNGGDDYISGMISLAENMSNDICEFCGSTENIGHTKGWIYTICKSCHSNPNNRVVNLEWKENKTLSEIRELKLLFINK
jgi:hypothetical protein